MARLVFPHWSECPVVLPSYSLLLWLRCDSGLGLMGHRSVFRRLGAESRKGQAAERGDSGGVDGSAAIAYVNEHSDRALL